MGYEVCAAIASKLAKPEARVFSVGGDGSFQMHAQELATAVEYAAPFVAVVLNDVSLASIRNAQLKRYGEAFGTEFKLDVNLSDVARAFGASGERITRPSELAPSLGAALNEDRPVVLDVMIDPTETPKFD
jgi:acetolactate synthase-1/2/3 large subunit